VRVVCVCVCVLEKIWRQYFWLWEFSRKYPPGPGAFEVGGRRGEGEATDKAGRGLPQGGLALALVSLGS